MFDYAVYNLLKNKGWKKQSFLISGTFTAPVSGLYFINGCGGGAGGGVWASGPYSGGGGSGCFMVPVFLSKGDSVSVVIGAGGAGATGTTLAPGGTTSFGSYIKLEGGKGGSSGNQGGKTFSIASDNSQYLGGGIFTGANGGRGTVLPGNGRFNAGSSSSVYCGAGGHFGESVLNANAPNNSGAGGSSVTSGTGYNGGSGYLEIMWQE